MDFSEAEEEKFRLQPGDLLVCEGGEPGRAAVWQGQIERCCYQKALHRIRPRGEGLFPPFLMYRLWMSAMNGEFAGAQTQTTISHVPREKLLRLNVPLPSLTEQRRIAAALTRVLESLSTIEGVAVERLAAAESLPAAYLREVFEGPQATKWESRPLGDIVQGNGQYGTSQRSNSEGRGLAVLGMPHIHQGRIRWRNVSSADLGPEDVEKYRLAVGDILFNRTNSAELVGKTAVFDGAREAVFASYLIRYRALAGVADPRFICAFVNSRSGRTYIERHMARAVGQVNISASTMHRMPVPCPPIADQNRLMNELSERLRAVELLVGKCREELSAINAIPAAVLRAAFNGDI